MNEMTDWGEFYGPPATDAPYKVGQTIFYDDNGQVENGEILYVAAQPHLYYIVSPAEDMFPAPVEPEQVITVM